MMAIYRTSTNADECTIVVRLKISGWNWIATTSLNVILSHTLSVTTFEYLLVGYKPQQARKSLTNICKSKKNSSSIYNHIKCKFQNVHIILLHVQIYVDVCAEQFVGQTWLF